MKIEAKFSENNTTIAAPLREGGGNIPAKFGVLNVLHDGQNGATFFPSVSDDGVISWTNDRELENPLPVNIRGKDGKSITVSSVSESSEDGGNNIVTFSDGNSLTVKNGKDGTNGVNATITDVTASVDSGTGTPFVSVSLGGSASARTFSFAFKNLKGKDGVDGKSPVKGTDYFTAADKAEMVQAVISSLPVYDGSVTTV